MINFKHSGATGDLIFSLPTIRAMGGGDLYIFPYDIQRALSIAPLIRLQPYINKCFVTDEIPEDCVNLDKFRETAGHHTNLIRCHLKAQGLTDESWTDGWLTLPQTDAYINHTFSVINTGQNYCDPNFDWKKEVDYLLSISEKVYYLGYESEFNELQSKFNTGAEFFECEFKTAAELIEKAVMFTGGYSALSTIAMGLGRRYRLVQAPGHTCSSLLMERETIVNL